MSNDPRETLITEYLGAYKLYKKEAKDAYNIYDLSDKKTGREFVAACYCEDAAWAKFEETVGVIDRDTFNEVFIGRGLGITKEEFEAIEEVV